jgi:hypothetical protein
MAPRMYLKTLALAHRLEQPELVPAIPTVQETTHRCLYIHAAEPTVSTLNPSLSTPLMIWVGHELFRQRAMLVDERSTCILERYSTPEWFQRREYFQQARQV